MKILTFPNEFKTLRSIKKIFFDRNNSQSMKNQTLQTQNGIVQVQWRSLTSVLTVSFCYREEKLEPPPAKAWPTYAKYFPRGQLAVDGVAGG